MTRYPRPNRRQRGLATLLMLGTISLVGLAMVAISSLFAYEAHRTRLAREEAQLVELLLAGGDVAHGLAGHGPGMTPTPISVELPAGLRGQGASLRVAPLPGGSALRRRFEVDAGLGRQHAAQVLTFGVGPRGWSVIDARLTRDH